MHIFHDAAVDCLTSSGVKPYYLATGCAWLRHSLCLILLSLTDPGLLPGGVYCRVGQLTHSLSGRRRVDPTVTLKDEFAAAGRREMATRRSLNPT